MKYCSLLLQSLMVLYVYTLGVETTLVHTSTQKIFSNISRTDLGLVPNGHSLVSVSKARCSLECLGSQSGCEAFAFETATGICTLGSSVSESGTIFPGPGVEVFSNCNAEFRCNTTLGYSQYTLGDMTACLNVSSTKKNYHDAFTACQEIEGRLFVARTKERLKLLEYTLVNVSDWFIWIGMDDLVTEGVYIWSDGTLATREQIDTLFSSYQPDNYYNEDCIHFLNVPGYMNLNDEKCSSSAYYVCEYRC